MADSIDSFPFKITINDTNEHEIVIHPDIQPKLGDYFFLDVTSGIVQISVFDRAITSGNATYDADVNPRCVLKNNQARLRYKASAAGAVLIGSA